MGFEILAIYLEGKKYLMILAKIEEVEVHVYLKIFGILQFRLFSGFEETQIELI